MPAPYSNDLRSRVLSTWQSDPSSRPSLPTLFQIGRATVTRWITSFRQTGSVAPKPHGGGQKHRIPQESLGIVRTLVEEHPDATLPELLDDYQACTQQRVGATTMSRALDRLDLTRKKNTSGSRALPPRRRGAV